MGPSERTWFNFEQRSFKNHLIRDYFLARKIIREVDAGRPEILLRYQFPQSVLLFLALLAPETAAKITGGQVARLEEKMQEEVERKLHLTFAHLLNRPVGLMRTSLKQIREAIGKDKAAELAVEFQRVTEEVSYIASLAEKTRLWQETPQGPAEPVALRALVEEVVRPFQERGTSVVITVEIEPRAHALAIRDPLRDALHCLIENAFHAVSNGGSIQEPRIAIAGRRIGDVIRIEVRDNGPGVPEEDRARIFEPLITTKKGGTGKPRGTGLGLPIARRYVECMGGKVGLDAEQAETCFYVDLVASKEGE
jgi:C4-dicarboxylate-specific signal transduction histidine kinase